MHPFLPDGHVVVTGACGAGSGPNLPLAIFEGKIVYAIGDADKPGQAGARKFAQAVRRTASETRVIKLPFDVQRNHGRDVRDFFNEGGTFEQLQKLADQSDETAIPDSPNSLNPFSTERTEIEVTPDESVTNAAACRAIAGHPDVYQRAGQLVHVVFDDTVPSGVTRQGKAARIAQTHQAITREQLTDVAKFYCVCETKDGVEEKQIHPPRWCVESVQNRGHWPGVRPLVSVVESPTLRPDGTIIDSPGYDSSTGLFLSPAGKVPKVSSNPTANEISSASWMLCDIVRDFPFKLPTHKSAWLASLLTPLARFAFTGPAPLSLIDGNVPGSGKSFLADIISIITVGRDIARMSHPKDDDEFRKRITALAIFGEPLVLIDNIAGSLGCASLDAALTATIWKDRILGRSEIVELPLTVTWYASGNNVVLLADTSRRVIHVRLESPEENPEERTGFKYPDLRQHVRQHRGELLAAALTILRGYFAAGKPDMGLKPWGSFEGWSNVVRSAVAWAGLPDPAGGRKELRTRSDREAGALRAFIEGWPEIDPLNEGLTSSELLSRLDQNQNRFEGVREAILELCDDPKVGNKLPSSRSVGNKLRHLQGRPVGGKVVSYRERRSRARAWCVRSAVYGGDSNDSGDSSTTGPENEIYRAKSLINEKCSMELPESPETSESPNGDYEWIDDAF